MKQIKLAFIVMITGILMSCSNYLDVVPDSIATIDYAFTMRASAEKYLFTCYSYMPENGSFNDNLGFNSSDELWYPVPINDVNTDIVNIAVGLQNSSSPYGNYWSGSRHGRPLFQAIRDCNTFLENVDKVPDLDDWERNQWKAEVKFLKAYYHYFLLRMYGPIPLIKENLPISASPEEVQLYREPVEECTDYIVQLLDEVIESGALPDRIQGTESFDLGRITNVIVYALKAKVLILNASPLFNGNTEYVSFTDSRDIQLINPVYDVNKWVRAADACKAAIDFSQQLGYGLYYYPGRVEYIINDTIKTQLNIRAAITETESNPEVIWPNTNSMAHDMQRWAMPIIASGATNTSGAKGILPPTLKMVNMFYSEHGVPIDEDLTWDVSQKYVLKTAEEADRFYVKEGEETVALHFNREPRFYAYIGFDRGVWFGNWVNNYNVNNDLDAVYGRKGEISARQGISNFSVSGYYAKKLVNIKTACEQDGKITSSTVDYPWPEIRMSDLYLLYSEALNEVNGYSPETTYWINQVRARAGLPGIEEAWTNYSSDPEKYKSKEGLREIIHRERTIELMFEGQRYWDLKRWKTAHVELNQPIKAWDITQESAPSYYTEILLANQKFSMRDYLWPIEISEMQINRNLVQNPGW